MFPAGGTAHFYHVYCEGAWREPVTEHLAALDASSYGGPFIVGLVGPPDSRKAALTEIEARRVVDDAIFADRGTERVTVDEIDRYVDHHDGAVMYAHTKGASVTSELQTYWRRQMTEHVILGTSACEAALGLGYDAVGCYWIGSENWPGGAVPHGVWGWGHFSGNFWIASCEFLRSLPPPSRTSRYGPEAWLGSGATKPRMLDLVPHLCSPTWAETRRRITTVGRALREQGTTSWQTRAPLSIEGWTPGALAEVVADIEGRAELQDPAEARRRLGRTCGRGCG